MGCGNAGSSWRVHTVDFKEFNEGIVYLTANQQEAKAFAEALSKDNHIDVLCTDDGIFHISWVPRKKYTALDGKEYEDLVWMKEDGTLILCQDLGAEHARNIIRMILRNSDRQMQELKESGEMLVAALENIKADMEAAGHKIGATPDTDPTRVLH